MKKFNLLSIVFVFAMSINFAHAWIFEVFPEKGFVEVGTATGTEPEERVLDGAHKVSDVTGGAGRYYDIRVGVKNPPSRESASNSAFLNFWYNPQKEEVGVGVGGHFEKLYLGNLGAFWGAGGGFGYQMVEGKERIVNNFATPWGYIVGARPSKRAKIVHNENTFVMELQMEFGLVYYITPKISINGAYEWKIRNYSPYYSVKGSSMEAGINTAGTEHAFRAGLKIKF
ncbi:MAG: hypothetical protein ACTTH5_08650 [Wolinella sp.]